MFRATMLQNRSSSQIEPSRVAYEKWSFRTEQSYLLLAKLKNGEFSIDQQRYVVPFNRLTILSRITFQIADDPLSGIAFNDVLIPLIDAPPVLGQAPLEPRSDPSVGKITRWTIKVTEGQPYYLFPRNTIIFLWNDQVGPAST